MAKVGTVTNLYALGGLIGILEGASESFNTQQYMDSTLRAAHMESAEKMDVAAAAYAQSSGKIPHMFEFGTEGVNRGEAHFSPTDDSAQLWTHEVTGDDGALNFTFEYRPAEAPTPPHTPESTDGIDEETINSFNTEGYVFWNRAYVSERGESVTVKPKDGGRAVFAPLGEGAYMLAAETNPKPGKELKNNFSRFWSDYWSSIGRQDISNEVRSTVESDVAAIVESELAMLQASASDVRKSVVEIEKELKKKYKRTKSRFAQTTITRENLVRAWRN